MSGRLSRRDLLWRALTLGLALPAATACGFGSSPTQVSGIAPLPHPSNLPARSPTPLLPTSAAQTSQTPAPSRTPASSARFAIVGDYGMAGDAAAFVSSLVAGWYPDFIISTGDNNYPEGSADTIDANIGQYYHAFIAPYKGTYGAGSPENRFFPVLGNHDWDNGYPESYLNYFSLPGNGRYYRLDHGPVSFFMLDSTPAEPDGTSPDSIQGQWLQAELAASTARWKVVVTHHPPFSSGYHGSSDWMQWPFAAWGAQLVLAGHEHTYERIVYDGITYVVNGLGGAVNLYEVGADRVEGSQVFFNTGYGAMAVEADDSRLRMQFVAHTGAVVDDVTLE